MSIDSFVRGTCLRKDSGGSRRQGSACEYHRIRTATGQMGCVRWSSRAVVVVVVDQNANGDETKHGELEYDQRQ